MKPETDSNVMSLCQCGCPEVSLAWADCLTLIACVCVCVCGFCACVSASALLCLSCLFMLQGLGEYRALLDPVTVSPLHPKSGPYASFVLPQWPLYMFAGFGFFNPGFQSHFNLSLLLSEIYGRLNAAVL